MISSRCIHAKVDNEINKFFNYRERNYEFDKWHLVRACDKNVKIDIWMCWNFELKIKKFYFSFIYFIKSNEIKSHKIRSAEKISQSLNGVVVNLSYDYN